MNNKIYLAAATLMLAACTNNEMPETTDTDVAMKVNAAISSIGTRASGTTWTTGDLIGISTTSQTKTQYTNIAYAYNGSSFIAEANEIYFQDTETVTFKAYYPYTGIAGKPANNVVGYTYATNQTAANQPKIDYLFAEGATGSKANFTVYFTGTAAFRHCMSQITLTFKDGEDVKLAGKLTEYTLSGLKIKGVFNTENGEAYALDNADAAADLTIEPGSVTTTDGQYTAAPLIVFPQDASTISLSVKVDGQTYSARLTVPDGKLQDGNNYTWTVTVNKTRLSVGTAEISPWQDVEGRGTSARM